MDRTGHPASTEPHSAAGAKAKLPSEPRATEHHVAGSHRSESQPALHRRRRPAQRLRERLSLLLEPFFLLFERADFRRAP